MRHDSEQKAAEFRELVAHAHSAYHGKEGHQTGREEFK
jgi:hypothetical protein